MATVRIRMSIHVHIHVHACLCIVMHDTNEKGPAAIALTLALIGVGYGFVRVLRHPLAHMMYSKMITTSEIRISCIIAEAQVPEAVRLLHSGFDLDT